MRECVFYCVNKLKSSEHLDIMKQLFDSLQERKALVCVWQMSVSAEGKQTRNIHIAAISENSKDLESVQYQHEAGTDFGFTGEFVFVYSEHMRTAFKAILLECVGPKVTLGYPKEMVMLPGGDQSFMPPKSYLDKFNLMRGEAHTETFDEFLKVRGYKVPEGGTITGKGSTEHIQTLKIEYEPGKEMNQKNSKHFLGMRESPRIAPKEDRYATVKRADGSEVTLRVLDLSRGGAGLALMKEDEMSKDEHVEIIAMQGKPLRKTLKGQVMAIRPMADSSQFKAGIKFVVEEDISDAA